MGQLTDEEDTEAHEPDITYTIPKTGSGRITERRPMLDWCARTRFSRHRQADSLRVAVWGNLQPWKSSKTVSFLVKDSGYGSTKGRMLTWVGVQGKRNPLLLKCSAAENRASSMAFAFA